MILQIDADYKYAKSLASTIMETALHQHFLNNHFLSITDCAAQFLTDLVFRTLNLNEE